MKDLKSGLKNMMAMIMDNELSIAQHYFKRWWFYFFETQKHQIFICMPSSLLSCIVEYDWLLQIKTINHPQLSNCYNFPKRLKQGVKCDFNSFQWSYANSSKQALQHVAEHYQFNICTHISCSKLNSITQCLHLPLLWQRSCDYFDRLL